MLSTHYNCFRNKIFGGFKKPLNRQRTTYFLSHGELMTQHSATYIYKQIVHRIIIKNNSFLVAFFSQTPNTHRELASNL